MQFNHLKMKIFRYCAKLFKGTVMPPFGRKAKIHGLRLLGFFFRLYALVGHVDGPVFVHDGAKIIILR